LRANGEAKSSNDAATVPQGLYFNKPSDHRKPVTVERSVASDRHKPIMPSGATHDMFLHVQDPSLARARAPTVQSREKKAGGPDASAKTSRVWEKYFQYEAQMLQNLKNFVRTKASIDSIWQRPGGGSLSRGVGLPLKESEEGALEKVLALLENKRNEIAKRFKNMESVAKLTMQIPNLKEAVDEKWRELESLHLEMDGLIDARLGFFEYFEAQTEELPSSAATGGATVHEPTDYTTHYDGSDYDNHDAHANGLMDAITGTYDQDSHENTGMHEEVDDHHEDSDGHHDVEGAHDDMDGHDITEIHDDVDGHHGAVHDDSDNHHDGAAHDDTGGHHGNAAHDDSDGHHDVTEMHDDTDGHHDAAHDDSDGHHHDVT
jgi:hypothetical protein